MGVLYNSNNGSILRFLTIAGWSWTLLFLFSDATNAMPELLNFCGSEPCIKDVPMSCADMIDTYQFQGSCCSIEILPETIGCRITVSTGNCYWYPWCGKCEEEDEAVSKCNNLFETDAKQDCKEGRFDPVELQQSEVFSVPECDPTISPTDSPDSKELIAGYLPRSRVTNQVSVCVCV